MNSLKHVMKRNPRWVVLSRFLPLGVGLLGGLVYLILTMGHAHGQVSVLDEGLYLYKGYLFAKGDFQPFQDFGPLTNHMPLSFLIPGWVQLLFGPGIRTGRYFAILLGLMMLLGLWLITRRLANVWWANAAVWAVVINPALLKMYSQATSQVLIACMLIWTLFFVLGEDRKRWQILSGVALSGLLLLTRINLAPVLVILLIYVFWNYGRDMGILALIVGVLVVAIGHAFYWPEILKLWAKWIPQGWSPFLDSYRLSASAAPFWDPAIRPEARLDSLITSIRLHLISIVGFLGLSFTLIARKGLKWPSPRSGALWLLISLYMVLFTLHAAASLGSNYCVYCLRNYIAFFSPLGLILFVLMGEELRQSQAGYGIVIIFCILVIVPFALGMPLDSYLVGSILSTDVPRISGMSLQPGTIELGVLLHNRFGLEDEHLRTIGIILLYSFLILVPLLVQVVSKWRNSFTQSNTPGSRFLAGALTLVLIELSLASIFFGNGYQEYDCGEDVILANEVAGKYLGTKIGADSLIYWGVGESPVPMLYIPNGSVFPPQLNGDYTFMLYGDSQELLRLGYWDQSLANDWIKEADYVLIDAIDYSQLRATSFEVEQYDEVNRTPPTNPCMLDSSIMIFNRQ